MNTRQLTHPVTKQEASEWFAKTRAGRMSEAEYQEFQEWLQASATHEFAYEQCKTIWSLSNALFEDDEIQAELTKAKAQVKRNNKVVPLPLRLWKSTRESLKVGMQIAALFIVAVGVYLTTATWNSTTYSTNVGEQRLIQLEDGSTALLNTNTRLRVRYSSAARHIQMDYGEAFFSVSKDVERPFEVTYNDNIVRAVGTAFNVAAISQKLNVDVTEGIVEIEAPDAHIVATMNAGEAVSILHDVPTPIKRTADSERISAWHQRKIYFDNVRLEDATKEYNRYSNSTMRVVDQELKDQRISGIFDIGDVDTFVFTLETALNAHVIKNKRSILVMEGRTD